MNRAIGKRNNPIVTGAPFVPEVPIVPTVLLKNHHLEPFAHRKNLECELLAFPSRLANVLGIVVLTQ
jgi:hypothetical protein